MPIEHVTLYYAVPAGVCQAQFGFEASALKCAREEGRNQFVIAIRGRILRAEGVPNPLAFING